MTDRVTDWETMRRRLAAPVESPARPHVSWQWYVDGVEQRDVDLPDAIARARAGVGFIWCGMRDPDDATMATFAELFGLHELAAQDAVEGHTRSKLEVFDDTLFMVVSTVDYVEHQSVTAASEIVSTGQIMVFLGPWFVMTSRRGGRAMMNEIRRQLEADPAELAAGSWRVLYRILDHVIDEFNATIAEIERDVEEVETVVFSREGAREVDRAYQLKRELIEFKRCVMPLSPPVQALERLRPPLLPEEATAYFREVADHLVATKESIQAMDEVLGTILQAALARASVADGQDMRKISAIVAILAIPTTLGAVYGMNFDNMPELSAENGYYIVLGVMISTMLLLVLIFRKVRWL